MSPAAAGRRQPDVLIVGAGIVGAACASHLAGHGLSVDVVDAGGIGGGATAAGMGHLVAMDDSPAQLALTRWSLDLWHRLAPELPADCETSSCGTLWVAEEPSDLQAIQRKSTLFRHHGIAHRILDGDELARLEPCLRRGLPGALGVDADAVVYPPRVAAHLLRRASQTCDVRCETGRRARRIEQSPDGGSAAVVMDDGERRAAGWIVNAAGHHAADILPDTAIDLRISPRKGHLLITERVPGFCRHQLVEVGYSKSAHGHSADSVAFNLQPRPNGQLLLGSSRQYGVTDRAVEDSMVRRMVQRGLDFVPGLSRLTALRTWTGFRAATPDHLPLIGPLPDNPRLLLATGHEGLGITTSLATGHLIADHILDRSSPIDPAAYRPERLLREAA